MTARRGPYAFPSEARLKKRRDFLRIRRRGQRVWGRRFIYTIEEVREPPCRLGLTVSRKVGGAVERNRIKRWVREVFRQNPELFARPVHIVVTAKREVTDFSYHTIRDEFVDVLTRYFRKPQGKRRSGGARSARRGRGSGDRAPSARGRV